MSVKKTIQKSNYTHRITKRTGTHNGKKVYSATCSCRSWSSGECSSSDDLTRAINGHVKDKI